MKNGYAGLAKAVSRWLTRYFAAFGLLVLSLSVAGALLNKDNILFCTQLLWLALFAALIACTFTVTDVLKTKALGNVLLRTVHFVLCYLSFLATFVLGGGAQSYFKTNTALTNRIFMVVCMSFLFIGIYAFVSVVHWAWSALVRAKSKPQTYKPLYTDLDDHKEI